MSVFKIPFWPEKISDEQYIERVRKGLRIMRRWRYIMAAIGLSIFAMLIWLLDRTIEFLSDFNNLSRSTGHGNATPVQQAVYATYFIGIVMGFVFGSMLFQVIDYIGRAFFEYRKDRLLVECWDALSDAEKGRLRQKSN